MMSSRRVPLVTISLGDDEEYEEDDNPTISTANFRESPQFRLDQNTAGGFVEVDYDDDYYEIPHSPIATTTIPTTPPRNSPASSPQPLFYPDPHYEVAQTHKLTHSPRPPQKQQLPSQPQQQTKASKPAKVSTPPPHTEPATLKTKPKPPQKSTQPPVTTTSPHSSIHTPKATNSPRGSHILKKSAHTEIPPSIRKDASNPISPLDTRNSHNRKNTLTRTTAATSSSPSSPSPSTQTHTQTHTTYKGIPSSTISLDIDDSQLVLPPPFTPHPHRPIVDVDFINSMEKELEVVAQAIDSNTTYTWNTSLNSPLSSSRIPSQTAQHNSSLSPNSSRTPSPHIKQNSSNNSNSSNSFTSPPLSSTDSKKKTPTVTPNVKLPPSPKYKPTRSPSISSPQPQRKNSLVNGSLSSNNNHPFNNVDIIDKGEGQELTTNADDIERLMQIEKSLRAKEEALKTLQNQLRQRETQVFILEEQTIAMMENEDKRLKEREERLLNRERELQIVDIRRKTQDEGSTPGTSPNHNPVSSPIMGRNLEPTVPSTLKSKSNPPVSNNITVNTNANSNVRNNVNISNSNTSNTNNTNDISNSNSNNTDEARIEQTTSPKRKRKGNRKKLPNRASGDADKDCIKS
eukprot:TRINITY_DN1217_c0_g2_i12.p1 TRINITY_DN1217_c0_g2~~TRINITY_DN1217_c0_g2_i12.p1  ORF type:complete len:628 (-),score=165.86 TRINITY_DN1217_c0_g2_i12:32-1915(-)